MAKSPSAKRKKKMDDLWAEVIKARAGYKSELSGTETGPFAAHHIFGKPNLALRYELKNGICLVNMSEHIYGVHEKNDALKRWKFEEAIKQLRGEDYPYLESLRSLTSKQFDWDAKEKELKAELRRLRIESEGPI